MLRIVQRFFTSKEANPYLVVWCLLLASLAETIGIGTLLPVISIAAGSASGSNSALATAIGNLLGWAGLDPTLGNLVAIVAVFMVLKALLSYVAIAYATIAASRVSMALRQRLLAAILKARWSYFSEQRSGKIANIIGREASQAAESYIVSANVVSSTIQAIAYCGIAIAINPLLALLAMVTGFAITFVLRSYVNISRKAGFKQTDRTIQLINYVVDMFANIKPLKTMHRQQPMMESIDRLFVKLREIFVTRELAKAGLARGGDAMMAVIAAIGIYLTSTFLKVPFADLIVSALVFNQIISVSTRLQRTLQMASTLEASYVRTVETIAEAEADEEINLGKAKPDVTTSSCRFEKVSFGHAGKKILKEVSLQIPANAITVLSGPSGSGKTTIVDLLIGLHQAESGEIFIGSQPIGTIDIKAWRGQIGYVPQELSLFHDSVRMNLTLGDESISDSAIISALEQAGAGGFVAELANGLDTDVGEMGGKLSGGQRQRISLARALVANPKVLILDEVTSALDPETEAEIVDNIGRLRGCYTIIAITHRPAWTRIADRLYTVANGRVTEVPLEARTV